MSDAPLILIVDDEEAIVKGLTFRLQAAGYRTAAASTGHEALQRAAETPPDLVLLDQCLPEMTGGEVLQALQQNEATRIVPVVLLTGGDVQQEDAIAGGAAGFLRKPYKKERLFELIDSLLGEGVPR